MVGTVVGTTDQCKQLKGTSFSRPLWPPSCCRARRPRRAVPRPPSPVIASGIHAMGTRSNPVGAGLVSAHPRPSSPLSCLHWTTDPSRPLVELTSIGQCVAETIQIANRDNVRIDKYVIMPNHIHMIVITDKSADDRGRSSLQQMVRNIKSLFLN